jgi:hypothetical protein
VIGVQMADEDLVQELVGDIEARDARRGARASVEEELVAIAQLEPVPQEINRISSGASASVPG